VAKARYVEPKGDEADAALPNAEQERWEREQLARTKYRGGVASVQAAAAAEDAAKYELLFEDQIEYVKVGRGQCEMVVAFTLGFVSGAVWEPQGPCRVSRGITG
jgi:hypothetical protein